MVKIPKIISEITNIYDEMVKDKIHLIILHHI